jgi:hypothetical protein
VCDQYSHIRNCEKREKGGCSRYEEDASKKKMGAPSRHRTCREFTKDQD